MPKARIKPLPKILGLVLIGLGVFYGIRYLNTSGLIDSIAPQKGGAVASSGEKISKQDKQNLIRVGVVTWGGYAGGQYFNGGFKPSKQSRYFKDYGILVEFMVMDDFNASRAAWKADEVDLMWITADAFPTEAAALAQYEPKIIFQADWSRGGDVVVGRRGINTVADLKGKKVAFAYGTPSHSFLLWLLEAGAMTQQDIEVVQVSNAVDAAAMFKAGQVDAAVVWSPDDEDCIKQVQGAVRLKSTREATHIIADVFYAKQRFIDSHQSQLKSLVEGWMRGAAEINTDAAAKQRAAQILAEGLNQDIGFCTLALDNVRLCTMGDNKAFFAIDGCNACVTGEQLYSTMALKYQQIGVITAMAPAWRMVTNTAALRAVSLSGAGHEAEAAQRFAKATEQESRAQAFASKTVSIAFPSASAALDENAKYIIDKEIVPILKAFGSARCRVEGNTDNLGSRVANVNLSNRRAQAAVEYLSEHFSFDKNRFIVVGNGPDKPVADNGSDSGRAKNRRTEFQLLN